MNLSDRIALAGMVFSGTHGVLNFEQEWPQPFEVDVELELPLGPAGRSDELSLTVDYGQAYQEVGAIVTGKRFRLLEALAEAISDRLLERFPLAQAVVVRVRKPHVPFPGPGSVQVEIRRGR